MSSTSAAASSSVSKSTFSVGKMVVGYPILKAGCSSCPVFGTITKVTPTGKLRIQHVLYERYDHPSNRIDMLGAFHAIKPSTDKGSKSWLAKWVMADGEEVVCGNNMDWALYDESIVYGDLHDNGD